MSYDSLPQQTQHVLRALATVPEVVSVPSDLAAAVSGLGLDAVEAELEICRLHGLLRRDRAGQWVLAWPVREFVRRLIPPDGEREAAHRRLCAYLLEWITHADAAIHPHSPSATALSRDLRAGRVACWFPDSQAAQVWWARWSATAERAVELAVALGDDQLTWQLAEVQWGPRLGAGDPDRSAEVFAIGAGAAARLGHPVEADLHTRTAASHEAAGDLFTARRVAEYAVAIAAPGGHQARALHRLALITTARGDLDRAECALHESLAHSDRPRHVALTRRNLARIAAVRGDLGAAGEHYQAAIWLLSSPSIGDHTAAAWTTVLWAQSLIQHGQPHHQDTAYALARWMHPVLCRRGKPHHIATALEVAADACGDRSSGGFDPAEARAEAARLRTTRMHF